MSGPATCVALIAIAGQLQCSMTQFTASPGCLNRQGIPQGVSVERHEGEATTIRIRQGDDCAIVSVTYKDQEAIGALRAAIASLPKASLYYQLIIMDTRGFWSPKFGDYSLALGGAQAGYIALRSAKRTSCFLVPKPGSHMARSRKFKTVAGDAD